MVCRCFVPGCSTRGRGIRYYCVPFTNKPRWEIWLKICPFLKKYPLCKRENIRFCPKHFLPEHVDTNLKLKPNAIPVLNLGFIEDELKKPNLNLEIIPTNSAIEPFTFKIDYSDKTDQVTMEQNSLPNIQIEINPELPGSQKEDQALFNEDHSSTLPEPIVFIPENTEYSDTCVSLTTTTTLVTSNETNVKHQNVVKHQHINKIKQRKTKKVKPRKQISLTSINKLRAKLRRLESKYAKLHNKLDIYAPKTKTYMKKYNIIRTYGKAFEEPQLQLTGDSSKVCRYTDREKIFALSLKNLSPKCYEYLQKHLALPCISDIDPLLNDIPIRPGINEFIFQHLANAALNKPIIDRQCTLIFDEMNIERHLNFNDFTGVIEGFEDIGSGEQINNVANKVLVFMLRGLFSPWKIPIAFYFTCNEMKTLVLKNIITEIVLAVFKAGFIVRATVSNQSTANVAAIKSLISDSNAELMNSKRRINSICYNIGSNRLYHIYNVPHLLKCFYTHFQKKYLFIGKQRAKWEYIETLFRVDGFDGLPRSTKLTEKHMDTTSSEKKKVKYAAQVFSKQVATSLAILLKTLLYVQNRSDSNATINNGLFTADIIMFVNNLFDSLNGVGNYDKKLNNALSHNSEHFAFWNIAIKKLASMRFDAPKGTKEKPLFLKSFVHNIKSIRSLWSKLFSIDGVKFLCLRRLNLDPMINFFKQIKAQENFNMDPNCRNFVLAFKSALITNITNSKSLCDDSSDDDSIMLHLLKNFVQQQSYGPYTENLHCVENYFLKNSISDENLSEDSTIPHIAGAICHTLMSNSIFKDCDNCKSALLSSNESFHDLIQFGAFRSKINWLYYPCDNLIQMVRQSIYVIDTTLPSIRSVYVYSELICTLQEKIDSTWYNCVKHKADLIKTFCVCIIRIQVKQWCVNYNNEISSIDSNTKDVEIDHEEEIDDVATT